jgi:Repeating coiled region of VPS13
MCVKGDLYLAIISKVLVAKPDENWEEKLKNTADSELHLVLPMSIDISLHRSLHPRVPQFKIAGHLPSLFLSLSGRVLNFSY